MVNQVICGVMMLSHQCRCRRSGEPGMGADGTLSPSGSDLALPPGKGQSPDETDRH